MVDLSARSYQPEIMDAPGSFPKDVLFQTLRELDVINRFLGGYAVTLGGLKKIMKDRSRTYAIVDYGCGGGDTLCVIADWAEKRGYTVDLTGVDFNADIIEYARRRCAGRANISFIRKDLFDMKDGEMVHDISICALFCHHFGDDRLRELINIMWRHARLGVVVNDLHRHLLAFHSIRLLTRLFSRSSMIKNDAPLSVQRAFTGRELDQLLRETEAQNVTIQWKWAFRYLITATRTGDRDV